MKDDLISRQAAIDAFGEEPKVKIGLLKNYKEGRSDQWFDDVSTIVRVPSAQPEIIRCKDCKHWYKDADSGMSCEYTEMSQPEDGFCNWAERRGEEDEID